MRPPDKDAPLIVHIRFHIMVRRILLNWWWHKNVINKIEYCHAIYRKWKARRTLKRLGIDHLVDL